MLCLPLKFNHWLFFSLIGGSDFKLIYRHYATLYFVFCVDSSESELGILDLIQVSIAVIFPYNTRSTTRCLHHVKRRIIQSSISLEFMRPFVKLRCWDLVLFCMQ